MSITLKQCDALQYLPEFALTGAGHVPLIVTDPPYWTLNKWREMGTTTRLGGHRDAAERDESRWFQTIDQENLWELLGVFAEIMAKDSFAYIFCDHEVLPILLTYAREGELPFTYSKPLVWDKCTPGMGYHWRAQTEFIIMLQKGKPRLNDLGLPDIFRVPKLKGKQYYPTEKPLDLVVSLIKNSSAEGDTVLDPFCGSGVVGEACHLLNRNAILLDIADAAIARTRERMALLGGVEFAEAVPQ